MMRSHVCCSARKSRFQRLNVLCRSPKEISGVVYEDLAALHNLKRPDFDLVWRAEEDLFADLGDGTCTSCRLATFDYWPWVAAYKISQAPGFCCLHHTLFIIHQN
jgi:hypothetical protein